MRLVQWCALVSLTLGSTPIVAQVTPLSRYQPHSISLLDHVEPPQAGVVGDGLVSLTPHGRFERAEAGETVELAALRLGCDPERLRRINRFEAGHGLAERDILCLEFGHRRMPDESLASIAALHETDVDTLRVINGLDADEEPDHWQVVQVPVKLQRFAQPKGAILWELRVVAPPMRDFFRKEGPVNFASVQPRRHAVQASDTWESLAARYHTRVEVLKEANEPGNEVALVEFGGPFILRRDQPEEAELTVGSLITIGMRADIRSGYGVGEVVRVVELCLHAELDAVLALNDLDAVEDLARSGPIYLPPSPTGAFGFRPRALLLVEKGFRPVVGFALDEVLLEER